MNADQLEAIRQLRALGAVRVRVGDVVVHFGPAPIEAHEEPKVRQPAPTAEERYLMDAIKGVS